MQYPTRRSQRLSHYYSSQQSQPHIANNKIHDSSKDRHDVAATTAMTPCGHRPSLDAAMAAAPKSTEELSNHAGSFSEFNISCFGVTQERPLAPTSLFGRAEEDEKSYENTHQQINKGSINNSYYETSHDGQKLVGNMWDAGHNSQRNRILGTFKGIINLFLISMFISFLVIIFLAIGYKMTFPSIYVDIPPIKTTKESYQNWVNYLPENSPYTHAISPYFSNHTIGNNIVTCFPSWTDGAYVLQWASPVELEFLGFHKDNNHVSSHFPSEFVYDLERIDSQEISDEDALCIRMTRLGATFLSWYDGESDGVNKTTKYVSASSPLPHRPRRRMIGWPNSNGRWGSMAWVLDLVPLASVGLGSSAIPIDDAFWIIQNATTMEERCEEIRNFGGELRHVF